MFRGAHALNLDAKGRVAVPVRFRQLLRDRCDGQVVVTIDRDDSALLVYPLPEWEVIEEALTKLPTLDEGARALQRMLIGHATECELDGNGRILLPSTLREYASVDKRIMVVGQGKKFEIWNEQIWAERREAWRKKGKEGGEPISERLADLSF